MIAYKTIDGLLLRDMAMAGSQLLENNREVVDALNVFPVPDGDTGTNMSLTMQSAIREINSIMHIVRFQLENGFEVAYVFNITKNNKYFLQRMRPYALAHGKMAEDEQWLSVEVIEL